MECILVTEPPEELLWTLAVCFKVPETDVASELWSASKSKTAEEVVFAISSYHLSIPTLLKTVSSFLFLLCTPKERTISRTSSNQTFQEDIPSVFKYVLTKSIAGFDNVECVAKDSTNPAMMSSTPKACSDIPLEHDVKAAKVENQTTVPKQSNEPPHSHSISISMPSSPSGLHYEQAKVFASVNGKSNLSNVSSAASTQQPKVKFHSQPIPVVSNTEIKVHPISENPVGNQQRLSKNDVPKDKRFDSFKTFSGRLERQLSNLRGRPQEPESESDGSRNTEIEALPVDRYFDALEGPELDTLRASEISALPEDKEWPFLLRFPISSFGICLGVSSQAILWKTLATSSSMAFLHVSLSVNLILWYIALASVIIVFSTYFLKVIFYFEAVRREYYHPVRVNFFFAPWIACLFLVLGLPPSIAENVHQSVWYILMAPILCLEIKIYGQWMSGGQRRLSKVANPSNHLSIVGNFVGALLGASMGLREGPIFFFAVGLAHYTVLFVTLYQRLPTNETLPKELHPVFFLFVAAPSVACTAWAKIRGDFDYGSRIPYFIALFLYFSLAVRINFFRGFKFSLAWWAYTFPMTGASIATIRYSMEITNPLTQSLSVALSAISTLTVTALLVTTVIHAFVLRDLFPNDKSIAITDRKQKQAKKRGILSSATTVEALNLDVGKFEGKVESV